MTGNPEAPEGGRAPADGPSDAGVEPAERPRSGPVTELALVAAGLGLVVYLLGFVDDAGPTLVADRPAPARRGPARRLGRGADGASARVLVPAAVATVTGALFLLHAVVSGRNSAIAGRLVLALLEAAAATGAGCCTRASCCAAAAPSRPPPRTGAAATRRRDIRRRGTRRRAAPGRANGRRRAGLPAAGRSGVPGPAVPGPAVPGLVPGAPGRAVPRPTSTQGARVRPARALRRAVRGAGLPAAPAVRGAGARPCRGPTRRRTPPRRATARPAISRRP